MKRRLEVVLHRLAAAATARARARPRSPVCLLPRGRRRDRRRTEPQERQGGRRCASALGRRVRRPPRARTGGPRASPAWCERHADPAHAARCADRRLWSGTWLGRRYETIEDLHAYGARVAGTVGAMMALVMETRDRWRSSPRLRELGVAMQLTNIARDVGEDARLGRVYLPAQWLEESCASRRSTLRSLASRAGASMPVRWAPWCSGCSSRSRRLVCERAECGVAARCRATAAPASRLRAWSTPRSARRWQRRRARLGEPAHRGTRAAASSSLVVQALAAVQPSCHRATRSPRGVRCRRLQAVRFLVDAAAQRSSCRSAPSTSARCVCWTCFERVSERQRELPPEPARPPWSSLVIEPDCHALRQPARVRTLADAGPEPC